MSDYDLIGNLKDPCIEYVAKGDEVYMNFGGDLLYLFDVKSNRPNTFAQQIVDFLNRSKPASRRCKAWSAP